MRALGVVLIVLAASACQDDAPALESTEAAHTARAYAWSNEPLQWVDSTYADLRVNRETLPDDHRIAKRMQTWADRIDAIVRSEVVAQRGTFAAPRPRVKIVPDAADQNAWVSSLSGCGGAGVAADATSLPPHVDNEDAAVITETGIARARPLLFHPPGWPTGEDFARHLAWAGHPCAITSSEEGFTSRCAPAPASHLAIAAASPFIHMTTSLLADVDEVGAVFLLAHELAHYYRAHPSPLSKRHYRFWYEVDPDHAGRPLPSSEAALLEATYRQLAGQPKIVGGPGLVSRYPARVRRLVVALARALAMSNDPSLPCQAASEAALGTWPSELLDRDVPSPSARAAYLTFEARLEACAAAQPFTRGSVLDPDRVAVLAESNFARISEGAASLAALLDRATTLAREIDAREHELERRLVENRIGLYTHEQEADDLALEIVTRLGISPAEALRSWIAYARASEAHTDALLGAGTVKRAAEEHGSVDAETCAGLAEKGFMDGDTPMFVSMGNLGDAHHADCYRIYNLRREAMVHRYVVARPPAPLSPPYAEIADEARRLGIR
jgi:hypothetical protein